MRRIVLAVMSTIAGVVVLFGYRTSTSTPVSTLTATVAAGTADPTGSTATTPAAPTPAPAAGATPSATSAATRTVTGQTEQTRWGPVQVQITVSGTRVTAISLLQLPSSNGRDAQINSAAVPVLEQETLQAQSARIDSVSGATYTSAGYIGSLQSALDQAGL